MKLKASVDYGIRAVLYLAAKGEICSSREISEEMSVPRDYLIQLALRLRNASIIKARPGKNGGYLLAKNPANITVGEVVNAFEGELKHIRQPMKKGREASETANAVLKMHNVVSDGFDVFMSAITVQDLLDSYSDSESSKEIIATALDKGARRLRK